MTAQVSHNQLTFACKHVRPDVEAFDINADEDTPQIRNLLTRYTQLVNQEEDLVQRLKDCESAADCRLLGLDLYSVVNQKLRELRSLFGDQITIQHNISNCAELLSIEEQPQGIVVANKYLEPSLVVRLTDSNLLYLAREGRLQVSASLSLALTGQHLYCTQDNKQDILQGSTVAQFDEGGLATFSKLKIMEVSSKHHQAFVIVLQLQEIQFPQNHDNNKDNIVFDLKEPQPLVLPIGKPTKSAPLYVQSRINKRKRECSDSESGSRNKKRSRNDPSGNYVDITPLLVLPQKEAATRLGISESMLCKRFKERTQRKWPYRYLRKIDKMLRVLMINKKGDNLPLEDQQKVRHLKIERDTCLHPVKIRITGSDRIRMPKNCSATIPKNGRTVGSESDSDSDPEYSTPEEEELESENVTESENNEDEEISRVASTLHLLKQGVF